MNNVFNGQILAEKLSKLNNSQQSIETLSHWCIVHRKKAKQVVETWEKLFNSCQKEQRVPFLYLANDILQNSRRKGSEFVNEFWKVLPKVLKDVVENGDEHEKSVVARLVDIWEERKVFGSRGQGLKDETFGTDPPKEPPVSVENNGKSSNSIKIVKKDANSIRIKIAVGGMPEKIVTAFQSIHDEHVNEDTTLNKCRAVVRRVEKMEKDVDAACTHGNQQESSLANEIEELETVLRQCMQQLGSIEAKRCALIARLKEALQEQESKLEVICTQVQIAQVQTELATSMRQRLSSSSILISGLGVGSNPTPTSTSIAAASTPPSDSASAPEPNPTPVQSSTAPQSPHPQTATSFTIATSISDEQHKKAAAAAMAAKLAASTSSAQMLSSVLSSLAAEEAAAAASLSSGGSNSSPFSTTLSVFPPEKRPKLEKPIPVSEITSSTYLNAMPQNNQPQPPFQPPPPPLPPGPPHVQQFVQSNGLMVGVTPYAFNTSSGSSLPPPPPPPSNMLIGLLRPATQSQLQQQQHSVTTGFYQSPPGMGFYGQNHAPTTPPVPRQ